MAGSIGLIAGLAGSVVSAVGTIAAGRAAKQQADFQAAQYDVESKAEFAAGQREAEDIRKNKEYVISRQQNLAAASGFDATDPSSVSLIAETAGYGQYQELMALAAGEQRRKRAEYAASASRASGKAALTGSYFSAAGTILGGFANAFAQRYRATGYSSRMDSGGGYGASGVWFGVKA